MALEYDLTIATAASAADVMSRALPGRLPAEVYANGALFFPLWEELHLGIWAHADTNGYVWARLDDQEKRVWEWEPPAYVHLTFRYEKFVDSIEPTHLNMLRIVGRVLAAGSEDLVLRSNGESGVLRRLGGTVERLIADRFWNRLDPTQLPVELQR